jgi:hypothetical protein
MGGGGEAGAHGWVGDVFVKLLMYMNTLINYSSYHLSSFFFSFYRPCPFGSSFNALTKPPFFLVGLDVRAAFLLLFKI